MPSRSLLLVLCTCLLASAPGCGGGTPVPVAGTLHWDDGNPVANASVRFVPVSGKSRDATGFTGKDGAFDLSSFRSGDGALPGDYVVVVTALPAAGDEPPPPPPKDKMSLEEMKERMKGVAAKALAGKKQPAGEPIPAVYGDPKTSPLRWTVDKSNSKVELKLKKA